VKFQTPTTTWSSICRPAGYDPFLDMIVACDSEIRRVTVKGLLEIDARIAAGSLRLMVGGDLMDGSVTDGVFVCN